MGQMFMVYFDGEEANDNSARLLGEAKVGGIILYNWANGLNGRDQVRSLCANLQKQSRIPLFIATDQEGGLVARLEEGFTEFPGNAALGRCKNSNLAFRAAFALGNEMKSVGVNFNLAPVVDINNNSKNPVIGIRSFGDDRDLVTQWGRKSLEGFQQAEVIACLKHFPGHGDVTIDSHKELPTVAKSLPQLLECELYPFAKLSSEAPAIMTAHILFPQIDPNHCATLSYSILHNLLRDKLKFQGLLVTDSLTMEGALKGNNNLEQVVFKAIKAGNDLLLIGGRDLQNQIEGETHVDEVIRIVRAVVQAVKAGLIPEERIDESVKRILHVKEKYDLQSLGTSESSDSLAREIAYRALMIKEWKLEGDLSSQRLLVAAPKKIEEKVKKSKLSTLGKSTVFCFFPNEDCTQPLERADTVVFCSYNAWKDPNQEKLLKQLSAVKPTICIALRDPCDLDLVSNALVKIATFSSTTCSLNVASEWLRKETIPFEISDMEAQKIGDKIWQNECNHREDQLTFWHIKEPFPSIGIGHFIWPPANYLGPFEERFHKFILFAKARGIKVPSWLIGQIDCPWATREDFYREFNSPKMNELRQFLIDSVATQARYMVQRLNDAFSEIVRKADLDRRQTILNNFFEIGNSSNGLYILIDYLNFKHEGTDLKERYQGEGWGLMQVLEEMDTAEAITYPQKAFAEAAKFVLTRRIANSPQQRIEQTRFPGWMKRLDSYL